jgi:hypothetical protein
LRFLAAASRDAGAGTRLNPKQARQFKQRETGSGLPGVFGTGPIHAGILFSVLTALAGWLSGGRGPAQRTSLGLATGFRSFPAALIVSVQNFDDPNGSIMVIVTNFTARNVLVPAALLLGKRHPASSSNREKS